MKKFLFMLAAAVMVIAGCNKKDKPEQGTKYLKLDEPSGANCIVVNDAESHSIDVTVRGNGVQPDGLTDKAFQSLNLNAEITDTKLIWEGERGWIASLSFNSDKKCIEFATKGTPGNALVGGYSQYGVLLWSWHVWSPGSGIDPGSVNLGATSAEYDNPGVLGFLYQWGRKEPFPSGIKLQYTKEEAAPHAVATLYGPDGEPVKWSHPTVFNASTICSPGGVIQEPLMFMGTDSFGMGSDPVRGTGDYISGETGFDDLWGGVSGKKTMLDPCPAGYKVGRLADFNLTKELIEKYDNVEWVGGKPVYHGTHIWHGSGWEFAAEGEPTIYLPAAGHYDDEKANHYIAAELDKSNNYMNVVGYYWISDVAPERKGRAFVFDSSNLHYSFAPESWDDSNILKNAMTIPSPRAAGYSVRCVKEK